METFVIMSYWYGLHDEGKYGEDSKVECVVTGTNARAVEIQNEIEAARKGEYLFCYCETIKTEVRS